MPNVLKISEKVGFVRTIANQSYNICLFDLKIKK